MTTHEGEAIVIAGASGRIGQGILRNSKEINILALEHSRQVKVPEATRASVEVVPDFDVTQKDSVFEAIKKAKEGGARTFVNVLGILAVDQEENSRGVPDSKMELTHVKGSYYVALACKEYDLSLIHISTEYVFSGKKKAGNKYSEKDKPEYNPFKAPTTYGWTKALSEYEVLHTYPENSVVLRVSQVQALGGSLFVQTLRDLNRGLPFNRVQDQYVSPITEQTAYQALAIVEESMHGPQKELIVGKPLHIGAKDADTPINIAVRLAKIYGLDNLAHNLISGTTLKSLAEKLKKDKGIVAPIRPKNSVLDVTRFQALFGEGILGTIEEEILKFHETHSDLNEFK